MNETCGEYALGVLRSIGTKVLEASAISPYHCALVDVTIRAGGSTYQVAINSP